MRSMYQCYDTQVSANVTGQARMTFRMHVLGAYILPHSKLWRSGNGSVVRLSGKVVLPHRFCADDADNGLAGPIALPATISALVTKPRFSSKLTKASNQIS